MWLYVRLYTPTKNLLLLLLLVSSTGDLVVQSVLDINEYQKRRIQGINTYMYMYMYQTHVSLM